MPQYLTQHLVQQRSASHLALLLFILLTLIVQPGMAGEEKKLYKWIDREGNIQYSDQVPPEASRQERAILNERGIKVQTLEAAKSSEQIAAEKRQAREREEQQRIAAQQAAYDQRLLTTYDNEDGLVRARNAKTTFVENIIIAHKNTLTQQHNTLEQLRREAADHERSGKKIPARILNNIESVKGRISAINERIAEQRQQQEQIRKEFEQDIERFRELKQANRDGEKLAQ